MVHKGTSSSYRSSTGLGFDLAWFSSVQSERLCIGNLYGNFLVTSFSLTFTELSLVGFALDLVD